MYAGPIGTDPSGATFESRLAPRGGDLPSFDFVTSRHWFEHLADPFEMLCDLRQQAGDRTVYGVVTDGFAYSDLPTPLHAVLGSDGDPAAASDEPTRRAEIRLYTAAVLRQIPEEPLQPVPLGSVWLASDADVALALRMDAYLTGERPTGIPVGLYAAGGLEAPFHNPPTMSG